MRLKHVFVAVALLSSAALADEELKPAQEEAKAKFEQELEDSLKATNEKCGTTLTIKSDFQNFKTAEWDHASVSSPCQEVVDAIGSMCDRPAYKKVIAKKLTAVACVFTGVKPAEKKDGSNGRTLRNLSLDKGTFTLHMDKDLANIADNTRAALEKAFN